MATNPETLAFLASLGIEVLMREIERRAIEAGMDTDAFIRETRDSIRQGRDENAAGRAEGHD